MSLELRFIQKDYEIPNDIITYLNALQVADEIKDSLFYACRDKVSKSEIRAISTDEMVPEMKKQASRFIKMLCDNNIFNRTIDEYTFSNEGYKEFDEHNKAAVLAMSNFLLEEMEHFQQGIEDAEREAASNITGTGVQVWSSSFLTLAAASALEYSALKKQANAADQQYREKVRWISKKGSDKREQQEIDYLNNIYYPNISNALTLFAYCMLDNYLADLHNNGLFDNETLNYVNIKHSQDLLQNLDITNNKAAVLSSAFQACPFNINVYLSAIEFDLFGEDEVNTLRTIHQDSELKRELSRRFIEIKQTNHIKDTLENYDQLINALCLCSGKTPEFYYQQYTKDLYRKVIHEYSELREYCESDSACSRFVNSLGDKILAMNDDDFLKLLRKKVNSIITDEQFVDLIEYCGYKDLIKEISPKGETFSTRKEINKYYIDTVYEKVIPIAEKVKDRITKEKHYEAVIKSEDEKQRKKSNIIKVSILLVLLALPIILYVVIVSIITQNSKQQVTAYIQDMIVANIQEESKNPSSDFNEAQFENRYEITDIKFYKDYNSVCIVPEVTFYSKATNLWSVTASLATYDLIDDATKEGALDVPFLISKKDYNLIIPNCKVICADGETIYCKKFDKFNEKFSYSLVNPYISIWFIVIYIIYAIILLIIHRKNKSVVVGAKRKNKTN